MSKNKLTQDYLKECLTYNPDTGTFIWNKRPLNHFKNNHAFESWNTRFSNQNAGTLLEDGYLRIGIYGIGYRAHRLAFLYIEGYIPESDVDHINRVRDDNRWENLREVSRQCNMQNCGLHKESTSGVCGVSFDKRRDKWVAYMMTRGYRKHIGYFERFGDAVMARYHEEISNPLWTCSVESTAYKYLKERNLI